MEVLSAVKTVRDASGAAWPSRCGRRHGGRVAQACPECRRAGCELSTHAGRRRCGLRRLRAGRRAARPVVDLRTDRLRGTRDPGQHVESRSRHAGHRMGETHDRADPGGAAVRGRLVHQAQGGGVGRRAPRETARDRLAAHRRPRAPWWRSWSFPASGGQPARCWRAFWPPPMPPSAWPPSPTLRSRSGSGWR